MKTKVISYSLFGSNSYYHDCAILCANNTIYDNTWTKIFYVDSDIPISIIDRLKSSGCVVIDMSNSMIKIKTLWRYIAIDKYDIVICRDVDSPPNIRELGLVNYWLSTNKTYHIIRDACNHNFPIMAGMFGMYGKLDFNMCNLIIDNQDKYEIHYLTDQIFLVEHIYPLTINNRVVHDSYNIYSSDTIVIEKSYNDFIGKSLNLVNNKPNGYIYFYNKIDLYNSEQLCSFMYELMEYIKIAKTLNRILVLPNVYIAPRDNKKILETKEITISGLNLISLDQIIDVDVLNYIEIVSLSSFYNLTKFNNTLLICRENLDICLNNNNNLDTPFGELCINDVLLVDNNFYSLNILDFFGNTDIVDNYKNVIVYNNSRLGQPNWHNISDYNLIRLSLCYKDYYYRKANKFVEKNGINGNTLCVHLRRGDRLIVKPDFISYETYDNETLEYYNNYVRLTEIDNVVDNVNELLEKHENVDKIFLITNSGDNSEIDKFMSSFNIPVIRYVNNSGCVLNSMVVSIVEQIIGSRCSIQLHGPSCYERMSAYGRWIIEESDRYYFIKNIYYIK